MITLAQCLNLSEELERMSPPRQVKQALQQCLVFVSGGCKPPGDLLQLVQSWVGRQTQQNRYGQ